MFDRQNLAFVVKDKIQLLPMNQLEYAVENNFINAETLYFNNTVLSKKEMIEKWIIPVKDSWLAKRINFPENAGWIKSLPDQGVTLSLSKAGSLEETGFDIPIATPACEHKYTRKTDATDWMDLQDFIIV